MLPLCLTHGPYNNYDEVWIIHEYIFSRLTNILSKVWFENKKNTSEEERLRVVEAAAAIIREDIRSFIVETGSYPPPSKMLDDINRGRAVL